MYQLKTFCPHQLSITLWKSRARNLIVSDENEFLLAASSRPSN